MRVTAEIIRIVGYIFATFENIRICIVDLFYHLSVLKKADLVTEMKERNFVYYELNTSVVEEIMLWLSELKGGNDHDEKI